MFPSIGDVLVNDGKSAWSARRTLRIQAFHGFVSVAAGSSAKEIAPISGSGVRPCRTFSTVIGSEPTLEMTHLGAKPLLSASPSAAAVAPGIVSRKTTLHWSVWNWLMYGWIEAAPFSTSDTTL